MKIYKFTKEVSRKIEEFGSSNFYIAPIIRSKEQFIQVGCMYIEKGGHIGIHEATKPQLFMVVEGEGWVQGREKEKINISKGEAAFWEKGEIHTAGTDTGLTAITIEGTIDPEVYLKSI